MWQLLNESPGCQNKDAQGDKPIFGNMGVMIDVEFGAARLGN
jgi:hypothetical protein